MSNSNAPKNTSDSKDSDEAAAETARKKQEADELITVILPIVTGE